MSASLRAKIAKLERMLAGVQAEPPPRQRKPRRAPAPSRGRRVDAVVLVIYRADDDDDAS